MQMHREILHKEQVKRIMFFWCFRSVRQQQKHKLNVSVSNSDFPWYMVRKWKSAIKDEKKCMHLHLTVCIFVSLCGGFVGAIVRDKKMSMMDRSLDNRFSSGKFNDTAALVD